MLTQDQKDTGKGWIIFLSALGMMITLVSIDLKELSTLEEVATTKFIANVGLHLGTVIGAFVGGRLIPTKGEF